MVKMRAASIGEISIVPHLLHVLSHCFLADLFFCKTLADPGEESFDFQFEHVTDMMNECQMPEKEKRK